MGEEQDVERSSRVAEWASVALCLFAVACYGIYLSQLLGSSLSLASEYSQYVNLSQVLESLYLFGRVGLVAFAIVESAVLFRYTRSGSIGFKRFIIYLLAFVAVSNLLAYVFISYLYGYATTIIK